MTFEAAQQVADAVLYEGYLLYPYRASSDKNRVRFQFGVVAPRAFSESDGSETWEMQTECLVEPGGAAAIDVRIRFLQLQGRAVEAADGAGGFHAVEELTVGDELLIGWEESVEQVVDVPAVRLGDVVEGERLVAFAIPGGEDIEAVTAPDGTPAGRIIRTRWPLEGRIVLRATADRGHVRLHVRIENLTSTDGLASRDEALRHSFLGCHTLLSITDGSFVSLTDPPATAVDASGACHNLHTWPVLVGADEGRLVLSSPIILPDHPEVAPESPGALFDSTEIDEILTLRILTLTDEEKRNARATDPRARAIIDRADTMPPEILDRLHGAIRYLRSAPAGIPDAPDGTVAAGAAAEAPPSGFLELPGAPDWPTIRTPTDYADDADVADHADTGESDPADQPAAATRDLMADLPASVWEPEARVAPELATIDVHGVSITKGSSVRLLPVRRADSMDFFLIGKVATVEAIFESVDDETFVAVTVDDDPATDMHRAQGRYFYFQPDEIVPMESVS